MIVCLKNLFTDYCFATLINTIAASSESKLHASSKASPTSFLNESTRLAILRFKCWNMILKFLCKSIFCRKSQYSFFKSDISKTFRSPPIFLYVRQYLSKCKFLCVYMMWRFIRASFPSSSSAIGCSQTP